MSGIISRFAFCLLCGLLLASCGGGGGGGSNPPKSSAAPLDSDGDGRPNVQDAFPNDPNEWMDTDKDGVGNNKDLFPNDATEWLDTDSDGVGDNADSTPLGQPIPAWNTFQGDSKHTGAVDITLNSANFNSRWDQAMELARLQQGAAGDGRIFINNGGQVYALDARDGSIVWSKSLNSGTFNSQTSNPPAYADGIVYVQTGGHEDAYLRAFNAVDGSLVFSTKLADQWSSFYAPTIVDGTVYIGGGYYGGMYAIDAKTGVQQWWQTLNQYDQFTPAVSGDYVIAYTGDYSPKLTVANKTTGNVLFEINDPEFEWHGWSMNLAPVVAGETVLANHFGRLVAFNLASKQLAWVQKSGFTGQPVVSGARFYIINNGDLEARALADGSLLSTMAGATDFSGNPLVTNNLIFVSDSINTYAYQLDSGALVWTLEDKGGSLMMAEGALIIVASSGVTVLDLESDIDGDDLPDWWEKRFGKNINPATDSDGDGLTGLQEFEAMTNPLLADTDNDGLLDGEEVNSNKSSALKADSDGDGLLDGVEVKTHLTDPGKVDSDEDGLTDAEEVAAGLNPVNGADALQDSDGDGFSNIHEVRANTGANDANSRPEIGEWSMINGNSRRNNYLPLLLNDSRFSQRWSKSTNISLNYDRAITSGNRLIERTSNQLLGWDEDTGSESWRIRFNADTTSYSGIVGNGDKFVYLSREGGGPVRLNRVNSAMGTNLLNVDLSSSGSLSTNQPLINGDQLYLINNSNRFNAYSLTTGNLLWTSPQSSDYFSSDYPHLATKDHLVALSGTKLKLYSVIDGSLVSSFTFPDNRSASALIHGSNNNLIVQFNSGELGNMGLDEGSLHWVRSECAAGRIAVGNGKVYVANSNTLCVLDEQTGAILWQLPISNGWQLSNLVLTASHLFYSDGTLTNAINLQQKAVSWTINKGGNTLLMSADGTLYIQNGQSVTAVDTEGDSDGDGMAQWWERRYGGDLLASADDDADGLTNLEEYAVKSDPTKADTDGDGLSDGAEVDTYLTNPIKIDSDLDGLGDSAEINTHNTDPTLIDSDGDGIDDGREISLGLDATDEDDASEDADGDGFSNRDEAFAGTSPTNPTNKPLPGNWVPEQGNAAHNGFQPYKLNEANFSLRWRKRFNETIKPIGLGAGKVLVVYSSNANNQLVAFNQVDGKSLWQQNLGTSGNPQAPGYMDGKVLVQLTNSNRLNAYSANDGAALFTNNYSGYNYINRTASLFGNTMYTNLGYSSGIVAKDMLTGATLWTNTASDSNSDIAVNNDYVFSVVGSSINALTRSSGIQAFSIETDSSQLGNPVLGTRNNLLVTQNGNSGAALASYDLQRRQLSWRIESSNSLGQPVNGNGRVYFLNGYQLQSLNEVTGELLWSWSPTESYLRGNVLVTFSHVFVSTGSKTYALSASTGELLWSYAAGGPLALGADGALYIQTSRELLAINLEGDSDSDGMADWWERHYGLNPFMANDAALDKDGDGLTNLQEFTSQSYPDDVDSDDDQLTDTVEINTHHTDPTNSDSDGDGMPDGWEIGNAFNPLSASDRDLDTDGDAVPNYYEFAQATDPNDALSLPVFFTPGQFSFEDGQLPSGWSLIAGTTDMGISLGVASHGTKALQARNKAGLEFSGFFAASDLSLDVKYGCTGNSNVYVYIDDQLQATFTASGEWTQFNTVIPLGQHRVSINTDSYNCSIYLDNIVIASAKTVTELGAIFVGLSNNIIQFHNNDGDVLRSLLSRQPATSGYANGLAVLSAEKLAVVFDGQPARVGLLNLSTFEWRYIDLQEPQFPNYNGFKGMAGTSHFVYLATLNPAMNTGRISRINLDSGAIDYFGEGNFSSLAVDSEGVIHAYADGVVYQYNPDTLALVGQVSVANATQIAFDHQDRLLVLTYNEVLRYSSQHLVEARIALDVNPTAIASGDNGALYVSSYNGIRHYSANWLQVETLSVNASMLASFPQADTDGDGIPDWWELANSLNPDSAADAASDNDMDGLAALDEFAADTNPALDDTDGDLLNDGDEVHEFGTNPTLQDTDGDGLTDAEEVLEYHTNPLLSDSDGDLLTDLQEINQFATDPNDAASKPAALSNFVESFESSAVGWVKPSGDADAGWSVVNNLASEGSKSLRSGAIGDSQTAEVEWVGVFNQGQITFDARVSSESCCDVLLVYVDNNLYLQIQTYGQWETHSLAVSAGLHTLRFVYRKDGSSANGEDAAWIDNIRID